MDGTGNCYPNDLLRRSDHVGSWDEDYEALPRAQVLDAGDEDQEERQISR